MFYVKKEYKELILDDSPANKSIVSEQEFVEHLIKVDLKPYEDEDSLVKGYELNDNMHWRIVTWKGKLILLPTL